MQLGLFQFGEASEEPPNLPAARHAIDLLAMVAEKTRGNLALEEQRLIDNSLTELRFRFVQVAEQKPSVKPAESPAEAEKLVEKSAEPGDAPASS